MVTSNSILCRATFIVTLGFLLAQIAVVSSQGTVDANDLPACASQCAMTAAVAAGCKVSDTACLCSHPAFFAATNQCARSACAVEDQSSVAGVLGSMCAAAPAASSSAASYSGSSIPGSSASKTPYPTATPQGSQATPSLSAATGTGTTPLTPISPTVSVTTGLSNAQSQSKSSTYVVVQTVVLPQASNSSGAVGRVDVDLLFGFGLVIIQAGIVLLGGVLLL